MYKYKVGIFNNIQSDPIPLFIKLKHFNNVQIKHLLLLEKLNSLIIYKMRSTQFLNL